MSAWCAILFASIVFPTPFGPTRTIFAASWMKSSVKIASIAPRSHRVGQFQSNSSIALNRDNFIEAFIHLVDQYEKHAKLSAKEAARQTLLAASKNLNAAGKVLNLFVDPSIPDDAPFSVVRET